MHSPRSAEWNEKQIKYWGQTNRAVYHAYTVVRDVHKVIIQRSTVVCASFLLEQYFCPLNHVASHIHFNTVWCPFFFLILLMWGVLWELAAPEGRKVQQAEMLKGEALLNLTWTRSVLAGWAQEGRCYSEHLFECDPPADLNRTSQQSSIPPTIPPFLTLPAPTQQLPLLAAPLWQLCGNCPQVLIRWRQNWLWREYSKRGDGGHNHCSQRQMIIFFYNQRGLRSLRTTVIQEESLLLCQSQTTKQLRSNHKCLSATCEQHTCISKKSQLNLFSINSFCSPWSGFM